MRTKRVKNHKKKIAVGAGIGVVVLAAAAFAAFSRPVNTGVVPNNPSVTPEPTVSSRPASDTRTNAPAPTSTPSTSASKAPVATVATLAKPEGSFLSSSTVSLSSGNTTQESTCKTAPGVTCTLVLKNSAGAIIAEIDVPEVDDAGGHLVYWDVKKYISQPGSYDVFAKATSGNKSSVSSTYKLGVQS